MAINKDSPKAKQGAERLPQDLRDVYWRMVEEYAFLTKVRYGRGYVAYEILADMVLAGWRPSAERHPESRI
ncbi:MAG TPA: hypothetical protein PLD73_13130 [Candidatus Hydrogenedentes bacterium]|jgi:hypothetical protein|nr:hypothetical protein [Candidatus Hydrogenedentota bacterium]HPK00598.1 hypothetical protein [Candidatus Hydrogenedentota bacterium]